MVKLAENAGFGFDKMINGWKAYTSFMPEFDQGQDYTKVTFYFKKREEMMVSEKALEYGSEGKWVLGEEKLGYKLGYKLGKREQLVLEAISIHPKITIVELSHQLNIATTTFEYNINKLKKKAYWNGSVQERKGTGK